MKKIFIFICIIIFSDLYAQNFSIIGNYYFDIYSGIEIEQMKIEDDENVRFVYSDKNNKDLEMKYQIIHDNGISYIQFSNNLSSEMFNKLDYQIKGNRMLFLVGHQEYYNIMLKKEVSVNTLFGYTNCFFNMDNCMMVRYSEKLMTFYDCSSFLIEKNTKYPVENLQSSKLETPWVEAAPGYGIGEGFSVKRDNQKYLLIMNGYISYDKPYLYKQNGRIKKLCIKGLRTGKEIIVDVLDTPHPQTVDISELSEVEDIRITIEDVYTGTKYEDTCLHYLTLCDEKVIPYE